MSFTEREYNRLSEKVIGAAIEVHKELGSGSLELVYEVCLFKELKDRNIFVERQVQLPVNYKGEILSKDFYIDILVERELVIEIKSIETINPVHEAQLLSYLRLSHKKLGLLINFNVALLKDGIKRKINGNLNSISV
jgi:GxxExxY protein